MTRGTIPGGWDIPPDPQPTRSQVERMGDALESIVDETDSIHGQSKWAAVAMRNARLDDMPVALDVRKAIEAADDAWSTAREAIADAHEKWLSAQRAFNADPGLPVGAVVHTISGRPVGGAA